MATEDYEDDDNASEFEQQKEAARAYCRGKSLMELATRQRELLARKKELKAEAARVNAWYDVLRFEGVPTAMEAGGLESAKLEGIGRVTLMGELFIHNPAAKRGDLYDWFRNNKLSDVITETINASTLKSLIGRRIKKGEPLPPPEILKVTMVTKATITKA